MEGHIYIYIDNSNLWIQGRKTHAALAGLPDDPTWRFDAGEVKRILLSKCTRIKVALGQKNVRTYLYGSTPPPVDTVWLAIEQQNVEVKTFERNFYSGREKKVDGQLIADAVMDTMKAHYECIDSEFIIVSGDSDISTAVEKIMENNFPVHVWSWKNGLAKEYFHHKYEKAHIHELDEHIDEISFRSEHWRGDIRTLPKQCVIVLDPDEKAWEIDSFLHSGRYSFRRYTIKPEETRRPGATSSDIAIIHSLHAAKHLEIQDILDKFYQEVSTGLTTRGLKVITFLEYEQQFVKKNPNENWKLSVSNRFSELPGDELLGPSDGPPAPAAVKEVAEPKTTERDGQGDGGGEFKMVYGASERWKEQAKKREILVQKRCRWREWCAKGTRCKFGHTDEERNEFAAHGPRKATKTNLCGYMPNCTRGGSCHFAHNDAELFCPTCGRSGVGHHMNDCPERNLTMRARA